jgi:hypothetical protein
MESGRNLAGNTVVERHMELRLRRVLPTRTADECWIRGPESSSAVVQCGRCQGSLYFAFPE